MAGGTDKVLYSMMINYNIMYNIIIHVYVNIDVCLMCIGFLPLHNVCSHHMFMYMQLHMCP